MFKQFLLHLVVVAVTAGLGLIQTDAAGFGKYGPLIGSIATVLIGLIPPAASTTAKVYRGIVKLDETAEPGTGPK